MSSNIYKHMPVIGDTNQYRQPPMEILLDVYTVDQIYSTRRIAPSTTKSQKTKYRFLRQQETVKIMYQQPHAPTNFGHERDVNTKICTQMSHTTWLNHVQQHPQNTTFDITYEIGSDDARGEERPNQLRNTPTPNPPKTQHPTPTYLTPQPQPTKNTQKTRGALQNTIPTSGEAPIAANRQHNTKKNSPHHAETCKKPHGERRFDTTDSTETTNNP